MEDFDGTQKVLPVFINNFNRVTCLQKLVSWLEQIPYVKIIILDNASTYPPLLDWYEKTRHDVLFLGANLGKCALWEKHKFSRELQLPWQYDGDWYAYTDADIVPDEKCPLDLFVMLRKIMLAMPELFKAGPGLRIDDVPRWVPAVIALLELEERFWNDPLQPPVDGAPRVFRGTIDTTMALYSKQRSRGDAGEYPPPHRGFFQAPAIRTAGDYLVRHTPWYINPEQLDNEEKWFILHATGASSMYASKWWTRYLNPIQPPAW